MAHVTRRHLVLALLGVVAGGCRSTTFREVTVEMDAASSGVDEGDDAGAAHGLRFAVAAMESPRDTYTSYARLLERVGRDLGTDVELVQRRTYREVNDMLTSGRLDVALLCTGGYIDLHRRAPGAFEVIAIPVIGGATTYQSLVIVPVTSMAESVGDLAGRRFAFTDELSFSGHTYLAHALRKSGHDPERFFGSTLYTHSHDRSIDAVADGIVDGAVVSNVVFEHQIERKPSLAWKFRVVDRSPPFGMMPIVAATRLPDADRARLRRALLALHLDPEAAAAMRLLRIDRFEVPAPGLHDSAARIVDEGG